MKRYTFKEVKEKFESIWQLSKRNQYLVCVAITHLPKKIADNVMKRVYFIDDSDKVAFQLFIKEIKTKRHNSLIFLSNKLDRKTKRHVVVVILHEIAHHWLKHKCYNELRPTGKIKLEKQEQEADNFVEKWLKG